MLTAGGVGIAALSTSVNEACCPAPDYSDVPPTTVTLSPTCSAVVDGGQEFLERCFVYDEACPAVEDAPIGPTMAECLSRDEVLAGRGGGGDAAGGDAAGGDAAGGIAAGGDAAGGMAAGGMAAGGDAPEQRQCCYGYVQNFGPGGCGRPFWVDGHAVASAPEERDDWLASHGPPPDERHDPVLAERWTRDALLEHASVASFARFVLDLLSVGAPASLVAAAVAAMGDEIAHARACFSLASRFGGRPVGPGPLPMADSSEPLSLVSITLRAVVEGCVGETLAALQAEELLAQTTDDAERAALTTIAADETEHACLAYRFVAWAARDGEVRAALVAALPDALGRASTSAWHARAIERVVAPCLGAALRVDATVERASAVVRA